jgi:hypothetical protein
LLYSAALRNGQRARQVDFLCGELRDSLKRRKTGAWHSRTELFSCKNYKLSRAQRNRANAR